MGLVISHARHHLHSYYVIRNSELLTGFTDREVEIMAQVARYHRKSAPKTKHEEYARLSEHDQGLVRILAGILRIANALDRSSRSAVRHVDSQIEKGRVVLRLDTDGDASLEVFTANDRKGLLESELGSQIFLTLKGETGVE